MVSEGPYAVGSAADSNTSVCAPGSSVINHNYHQDDIYEGTYCATVQLSVDEAFESTSSSNRQRHETVNHQLPPPNMNGSQERRGRSPRGHPERRGSGRSDRSGKDDRLGADEPQQSQSRRGHRPQNGEEEIDNGNRQSREQQHRHQGHDGSGIVSSANADVEAEAGGSTAMPVRESQRSHHQQQQLEADDDDVYAEDDQSDYHHNDSTINNTNNMSSNSTDTDRSNQHMMMKNGGHGDTMNGDSDNTNNNIDEGSNLEGESRHPPFGGETSDAYIADSNECDNGGAVNDTRGIDDEDVDVEIKANGGSGGSDRRGWNETAGDDDNGLDNEPRHTVKDINDISGSGNGADGGNDAGSSKANDGTHRSNSGLPDVEMVEERSRGQPAEGAADARGGKNREGGFRGSSRSPAPLNRGDSRRNNNRGPSSVAGDNDGTTLYVRNLPTHLHNQDVKNAFGRFGEIMECRIVINPVTKESRGFGFVSYRTPEGADNAMKQMDQQELEGKVLKIERAKRSKPHEPTPGEYKGPTGASIKYDTKGRLKPGYVPYWDLAPPRGAEIKAGPGFLRTSDPARYDPWGTGGGRKSSYANDSGLPPYRSGYGPHSSSSNTANSSMLPHHHHHHDSYHHHDHNNNNSSSGGGSHYRDDHHHHHSRGLSHLPPSGLTTTTIIHPPIGGVARDSYRYSGSGGPPSSLMSGGPVRGHESGSRSGRAGYSTGGGSIGGDYHPHRSSGYPTGGSGGYGEPPSSRYRSTADRVSNLPPSRYSPIPYRSHSRHRNSSPGLVPLLSPGLGPVGGGGDYRDAHLGSSTNRLPPPSSSRHHHHHHSSGVPPSNHHHHHTSSGSSSGGHHNNHNGRDIIRSISVDRGVVGRGGLAIPPMAGGGRAGSSRVAGIHHGGGDRYGPGASSGGSSYYRGMDDDAPEGMGRYGSTGYSRSGRPVAVRSRSRSPVGDRYGHPISGNKNSSSGGGHHHHHHHHNNLNSGGGGGGHGHLTTSMEPPLSAPCRVQQHCP